MSEDSPRSPFPQQLTTLMSLETALVAALAGTSSDLEVLEAELSALLMGVGRGVLTSILGGLSEQESFAEEGYRQAASELEALYVSDGSLARRCREVASARLSLETGAEKYWALYQSVGDGAEERQLFPATPGQA